MVVTVVYRQLYHVLNSCNISCTFICIFAESIFINTAVFELDWKRNHELSCASVEIADCITNMQESFLFFIFACDVTELL